MPEAAGGAAVLVDPFDPADIARGLARRSPSATRSSRRVASRAARRNWDDVAGEHLEVYRWALRSGHKGSRVPKVGV